MAAALLPDPLWDLVEPFLPTPRRQPKGGRPRVSDRACFIGILFYQIDWSGAVVDSCSIRAVHGGDQTGPNPTDRAKRGSKRHLICDGRGVPLAVRLTGANRNDSQEALALVDAIPPLHGERGRPRQRPDCVLGDRGYDAAAIRRGLRTRHIVPLLAMRRTEAWEWPGSVALGRGAHLRLAQSIPTPPRPLRQTGRHPRGLPLTRVRDDLLAHLAEDMGDQLI
jgi:transposase